VVFRILPHELRAKARSEGPSGNRALQDGIPHFLGVPCAGILTIGLWYHTMIPCPNTPIP